MVMHVDVWTEKKKIAHHAYNTPIIIIVSINYRKQGCNYLQTNIKDKL